MKNLKNIIEAEKSLCNFSNRLDSSAMIKIKGGDGDDVLWDPEDEEELWPPEFL